MESDGESLGTSAPEKASLNRRHLSQVLNIVGETSQATFSGQGVQAAGKAEANTDMFEENRKESKVTRT